MAKRKGAGVRSRSDARKSPANSPAKSLAEIARREKIRVLKRERVIAREKKRVQVREKKRDRISKRESEALKARERTRRIRPFVNGFTARDGYDMRSPKNLTRAQRQKIERVYLQLAPLILKPHIRVRAPTKKKLRALKEFQRIEHAPRNMRAVPIITPTPENTKVTVDETGVVTVRRGAVIQEYYFVPEDLERHARADTIAREMLKGMPAGQYFILTGEHEAYSAPVMHDPDDDETENLALRTLRAWIMTYKPGRVREFFRGFRRIGGPDAVQKVFAEQKRFRARRKKLDKARKERRDSIRATAQKRARREVPK